MEIPIQVDHLEPAFSSGKSQISQIKLSTITKSTATNLLELFPLRNDLFRAKPQLVHVHLYHATLAPGLPLCQKYSHLVAPQVSRKQPLEQRYGHEVAQHQGECRNVCILDTLIVTYYYSYLITRKFLEIFLKIS